MSSHGPIEAEYREKMNALAAFIDDYLNPWMRTGGERAVGFTLLMFAFDDEGEKRMNYISNAQRAEMVTAMKELIANFEGRMMPDARNQ